MSESVEHEPIEHEDSEAFQTERYNKLCLSMGIPTKGQSVPQNDDSGNAFDQCPEALNDRNIDADDCYLPDVSGMKASVKVVNNNAVTFEASTISPQFLDDLKDLEPREWIVKNHLLRGYLSCMFAPGGVGKSVINLVLAISVATNHDLLGLGVIEQCNVLIINNEDDEAEIKRRIGGVLSHYSIESSELTGKLFYKSGYGNPLLIANKLSDGAIIHTPNVEAIKEFTVKNNIGAIFIDPFISTHLANENDNGAMDQVASVFKYLANETHCSVSLAHHTRKLGGDDSEAFAGDADIGRGATALKDASRCVDTLAKMSKQTAAKLDFNPKEQARHVRLDNGKNNFGAPDDTAIWFYMESVLLVNGDYVGVPKPVNLAPLFEKNTFKDKRKKWTAHNVAETIHGLISKDDTPFTEIKSRLMMENNISTSQVNDVINLVSYNEKIPTTIKINNIYYRYYLSKKNQTAPIMIHRREQ